MDVDNNEDGNTKENLNMTICDDDIMSDINSVLSGQHEDGEQEFDNDNNLEGVFGKNLGSIFDDNVNNNEEGGNEGTWVAKLIQSIVMEDLLPSALLSTEGSSTADKGSLNTENANGDGGTNSNSSTVVQRRKVVTLIQQPYQYYYQHS